METVMLNDGSIEIVGSHRDLVDIVRDRCGDDIAKMVENLDPAVYDSLYRADCTVFEMANILENTDENGLLSEDQSSKWHCRRYINFYRCWYFRQLYISWAICSGKL